MFIRKKEFKKLKLRLLELEELLGLIYSENVFGYHVNVEDGKMAKIDKLLK